MRLEAGRTLEHYEVLEPLGSGSMGQVYRARDLRLGRDVAVKLLPDELAADAERLGRFEREARTLASLNHPNVAGIHGVGGDHGTRFLALELVPGRDLSDRLAEGPLPLDEAIDLCRQVAAGLEAAHEAGVVHRDLKPANVRVTPEGVAKVLDFGLAKTVRRARADATSPDAETAQLTSAGLLLGTPVYMSPEQVRGRAVDRRMDVWSFGCLLFECLAGARPFGGDSVPDVLIQVLQAEPDWSKLPEQTPPALRRLLERCLTKDPRRRLRDVGEARVCLEDLRDGGGDAADVPAAAEPSSSATALWGLGACAVVGVGLAAFALARGGGPEPLPEPYAFEVTLPAGQRFPATEITVLAVSHDGRRLAYVAEVDSMRHLFARALDGLEVRRIEGTEGASDPVFSPDGEWLAFQAENEIRKVPWRGGPVARVASVTDTRGIAWGVDGSIAFTAGYANPLSEVSSHGGDPRDVTAVGEDRTHRWPDYLPGGGAVLFAADDWESATAFGDARVLVLDRASGETATLLEAASMPRFVAPDLLFFTRGKDLMVVRFDPEERRVLGTPIVALEGGGHLDGSGAGHVSISASGTLVTIASDGYWPQTEVVLRRPDGTSRVLDLPPGSYHYPRLSPDGTRIVLLAGSGMNDGELLTVDLGDDRARRLTLHGRGIGQRWSPDGKRIAYAQVGAGILALPADGSTAPRTLYARENLVPLLCDWHPGGNDLLLSLADSESHLATYTIGDEAGARPFVRHAFGGSFSPDGKWVAYTSRRDDRPMSFYLTEGIEVFVRRYPDTGAVWQVSTSGGHAPVWCDGGAGLMFVEGDDLVVVETRTGATFEVGAKRVEIADFRERYASPLSLPSYDVLSDGSLAVYCRRPEHVEPQAIQVHLGWTRTIDERLGR